MQRRFLVCLLLASAAASASTTIMPTGVDWNRGGSVWIKEDGTDVHAYFAGVITIRLTENGNTYDRDTLCVDLFTDISLNTLYETHIWTPNQVPGKNLDRVSWLVDNALLPTESSYASSLPEADWVRSAAQGTGIQLAIWDIVHDNGLGFGSGRLQAASLTDPTVLYWAQRYELLSLGKSSNLAYIYDNVHIGTTVPAQMLAGPMFLDGGPSPNPEPGTMVMFAAGLGAVVLVRMRRTRSRSTD